MTPAEKDQLVALFNARCYTELESAARAMITRYPEAGLAWKLLSMALQAQGKDALEVLQTSARLSPGDPTEHCNLGAALQQRGLLAPAAVSCRRALTLKPDFLEALGNLGIALQGLGHLEQAALSYRRALHLHPSLAPLHNNLGNVLRDLGQAAAAQLSFRRTLVIAPDFAAAWSNLGNVLNDLGQFHSALAYCNRTLAIQPNFAAAYGNLGNTWQGLMQPQQAAACYRRSLELDPHAASMHNNLGNVLRELGQYDMASASLLRALELRPEFAEAHNNLGLVYKRVGRLEEAAACYQQALAHQRHFAQAHSNLADALKELGRTQEALASYRRALALQPDLAIVLNNLGALWRDLGQFEQALSSFKRALDVKPDYANASSNLLFSYHYLSDQPAASLLAEAQRFGDTVARQARPPSSWPAVRDPQRSLRVGLVSGDLRRHPVGYFIESALSALAAQAAERLTFIAYCNYLPDDALSERIKKHCHGWRSVMGLSDEHLARQIRDDGIDILIDLSGHTAHNRLPMFAWKPAPVQATWLGYFATTGVAAIDYLIADPWTAPAEEDSHFTETIWRLPETRLCFTAPEEDVAVSALPALSNGHITFGCFGNLSKMNDAVIALWVKILHAQPHSRLFLKAKQLGDELVCQQVRQKFAAHGIHGVRLLLQGPTPRKEYLFAYREVDIVLDTFPFPGGTTTAEALWMGVPVLSLCGACFLQRQGAGLLANAGLPDWIAQDSSDYVTRALTHAANLPNLAALRAKLRQQVLASPLFDAPRFAANFETALRRMWGKWCRNA